MLRIRSTIAHSVLYESSAPCMESQVPHYPDGERGLTRKMVALLPPPSKDKLHYFLKYLRQVLAACDSRTQLEDIEISNFSSEFGTSGTSRPRIPSITRASKQYRECCCGIPKHIPIIRTT
uniref:Uncharacterized protein n=1 Tax=Vespula pensylvanica TaxID=30213 RepID=A0A834UFJ2_VESPE|nr:hypothetical protein H0235_003676 [Vespula pensylvanica]